MSATRRVLVVDDNPANLELMSYLLRARDYEVVEASTAATAREHAARGPFDLLVLDIRLPDADGTELLAELRHGEGHRHGPAAAVTAFAMATDRDDVLDAGFDLHLVKPIDPRTFAGTLEALLPADSPDRPAATLTTEGP